ncbi:hypothetical protein EDC04DRAFT_2610427 [Pisolithus marmoratus]|nr:hypothetical protein EDC04DRAFT_2610427 [Pisolithus marmoratus]
MPPENQGRVIIYLSYPLYWCLNSKQGLVEFRIPPLETRLKWGMNLAQLLGIQPSSHVWCNVLCKQLCAGVISKEDIVQDDDCDEDGNIPKSLPPPKVTPHCSSHPPLWMNIHHPMATWIAKLRNKQWKM